MSKEKLAAAAAAELKLSETYLALSKHYTTLGKDATQRAKALMDLIEAAEEADA